MATIGEVNEIPWKFVIQWKIQNFLSLSKKVDEFYCSPLFSFAGASWCLSIYPNGQTKISLEDGGVGTSSGYIDLYLCRKTPGPPISLEYCLGLKTTDDKIYDDCDVAYNFKMIERYGCRRFLNRSVILEKKNKLMCSGALSVVCRIKYPKSDGIKITGELQRLKKEYEDSQSMLEKENDELKKELEACKFDKEKSDLVADLKETRKASEKVIHDFKTLMLSREYSDVTVKVKEVEFRLHRNILAARSPYFDAMFKNDMKEKSTGIVRIEDCDPGLFRSFVHFLYTGKVDDLSPENVCDLYKATDQYQEDQLKKECLHFMLNTLSVDSFCNYFVLALRHDEKELFQKSVEFFLRERKEIARTVQWQTFVKEYPTQANELFIKALDHSDN